MADDPTYSEFSEPRLVAVYDLVNPIASYRNFYLEVAERLSPRIIVDIGCGTGLLTCELAGRGYEVIGLEPSPRLIDLARRRPGCEDVRWIEGHVERLGETRAGLAIMSGHVAQFFLDSESWLAALAAIHAALTPDGHLVFESRNPLAPPFAGWPTVASHARLTDPIAGELDWWSSDLEKVGDILRYEIHYLFRETNTELVSRNELIFRSREDIVGTLSEARFSIVDIYGDWDGSPADDSSPEMIFVAKLKT